MNLLGCIKGHPLRFDEISNIYKNIKKKRFCRLVRKLHVFMQKQIVTISKRSNLALIYLRGRSPWKGLLHSSFTGNIYFLHFGNTHRIPSSASLQAHLTASEKTQIQFPHTQILCQINAQAMETVMQSQASVFWFYPINHLTLGLDQTRRECHFPYVTYARGNLISHQVLAETGTT